MNRRLIALGGLVLLANSAAGQAQLPTVDEAIAISERTGRPIFAMAGQKT